MKAVMEEIRKNWMLIGFIAAMILWYGNVNSRLSSVEAQQIEQATVSEKVDALITDVAVIKTKTEESSKKIDTLSGKIDYIISNMKR